MGGHTPTETAPAAILRDRLGLSIADFAAELGVTRATAYALDRGGFCRPETWWKLRRRWGLEIRAAGLRPVHFLLGTTELDDDDVA